MRSFSRSLVTFLLTIVIGGIAVGACLAALIPGTVEIATGHHYTAKPVGELSALTEPSTIYWASGQEMATLAAEARDPIVVSSAISPMPHAGRAWSWLQSLLSSWVGAAWCGLAVNAHDRAVDRVLSES